VSENSDKKQGTPKQEAAKQLRELTSKGKAIVASLVDLLAKQDREVEELRESQEAVYQRELVSLAIVVSEGADLIDEHKIAKSWRAWALDLKKGKTLRGLSASAMYTLRAEAKVRELIDSARADAAASGKIAPSEPDMDKIVRSAGFKPTRGKKSRSKSAAGKSKSNTLTVKVDPAKLSEVATAWEAQVALIVRDVKVSRPKVSIIAAHVYRFASENMDTFGAVLAGEGSVSEEAA
jgi:hypothetical protein